MTSEQRDPDRWVCAAVHPGRNPTPTWIGLLDDMRFILAEKGFTQIPQLSSSRQVLLTSEFELKQDGGRTKVPWRPRACSAMDDGMC